MYATRTCRTALLNRAGVEATLPSSTGGQGEINPSKVHNFDLFNARRSKSLTVLSGPTLAQRALVHCYYCYYRYYCYYWYYHDEDRFPIGAYLLAQGNLKSQRPGAPQLLSTAVPQPCANSSSLNISNSVASPY